MAAWEASVALARILDRSPKDAEKEVLGLLALANIKMADSPSAVSGIAVDAFERYGKGRHKAGLNFDDCSAYACARHFGMPLLYKGADFALTDIEAA